MFVCIWTNVIFIYTLNNSVSSHLFTFALMTTGIQAKHQQVIF